MRLTTATTANNDRSIRDHYFLHNVCAWLLLFWAISPLFVVLIATYRQFPLSELSYMLLAVFLTLHATGAHYTYSKVSLGFWIPDLWDLDRNHLDRIVHFLFGFHLAYPLRELFLRRVRVRGFWAYYLPNQRRYCLERIRNY
jgi:putative membrane protein